MTDRLTQWLVQADANVETWGQQDIVPLLLAIAEELAELSAEVTPEREPGVGTTTIGQSLQLLRRIEADGDVVRQFLEAKFEDADGQPVDDPPPMVTLTEDVDLDRLQAELDDLAALVIQLQWALDQAAQEGS